MAGVESCFFFLALFILQNQYHVMSSIYSNLEESDPIQPCKIVSQDCFFPIQGHEIFWTSYLYVYSVQKFYFLLQKNLII